jgi:curved DNA-binding protein CbpA
VAEIAEYLLVLGLGSCESEAQLKLTYRREIMKWHPDRFQGDVIDATERCKKINEAYQRVSEWLDAGAKPQPSETEQAEGYSSGSSRPYRTQRRYNEKSFKPGFPDVAVVEIFVKSSHIVSVGYKRADRTLYVKFDSNDVYAYFGVPESVFSDFLRAESHGRFAIGRIYSSYKSVSHGRWENAPNSPK